MTNWTKLYLDGHDLDEEFDPFEPIHPSGSCQSEDETLDFDRDKEKDDD